MHGRLQESLKVVAEIRRGGGGLQRNFFQPFGPHFGRKIRVGGRAFPLDPPLRGGYSGRVEGVAIPPLRSFQTRLATTMSIPFSYQK